MKKIVIEIEKGKTLYAAYSIHLHGLHVTGMSIDEIKTSVLEHIDVIKQKKIGEIPPELSGEYEIDWQFHERTNTSLKKRVDSSISSSKNLVEEAIDFLRQKGHEFDLTPWVTLEEYCRKFGIDTPETISEWIQKGIIPPEDVATIKIPHRIQIIRAKKYKQN